LSGAVFGSEYAAAYDTLYRDKDYAAECDVVERAFQQYGQDRIRRVLDLGCGTGGHAAPLAERGYEVVGVDRSSEMLERARARTSGVRFELGDLTTLDLGEAFDAALMMFAVLGYQVSNADVAGALAAVRRHLRPGGLFVCDLWYGPAVLADRPGERVKLTDSGEEQQIIRVATSDLDTRHQVCAVRYRVWRLAGERILSHTREEHRVRFFFPLELEAFFESAGLELLRLGGFPNLDAEPGSGSWNAGVVARAV
jgi:SAM-dependent methyltransferase